MRKVIAFSLYNSHRLYLDGAVRCIEFGRWKYPDFCWRFYVGDSVPVSTRAKLRALGAQLISMTGEPENHFSMLWRFYAAEDADIMISRDADSVILWREWHAVQEWLKSNRLLHTMRDNRHHAIPMLGGLWGVRGKIKNIRQLIADFPKQDRKGIDQDFLREKVWPIYRDRSMAHVGHGRCLLYGSRDRSKIKDPNQAVELDFPTDRIRNEFCGQVDPPTSHNHCF